MNRLWILALLLCVSSALQAQSFSYRGTLDDNGVPAEGRYDLQIRLYADAFADHALSSPIELRDIAIVDGRFAVSLDFPALPPQLNSGWLQVAVKSADDGVYWPLPERSEVMLQGGICPASWELGGNAGTDAAINFIGTVDNQPLVLRARNLQVARYEPSSVTFEGTPITANVIAGYAGNRVFSGVRGATIAGGGSLFEGDNPGQFENLVTANYGAIGGGYANRSGSLAAVAGGIFNHAFGEAASVGGGFLNFASGLYAAVGGGRNNSASGESSAVGGGQNNKATGGFGVVAGGSSGTASAGFSTVSGGLNSFSTSFGSVVGGGIDNTASGGSSTVPGGYENCAGGTASFAAGSYAKVRPGPSPFSGEPGVGCAGVEVSSVEGGDEGTFVWADSEEANFVSTGSDQFLVRSRGGVGINTNAPAAQLHVQQTTAFSEVARFSNAQSALVRIESGETSTANLHFSTPLDTRARITAFDSGTFMLRSEGGIQLRSGGNFTRFQLTEDGGISIRRGPNAPDADKAIQVGTSPSTGNGAHLTNTGVWTSASSRSFKTAFEALDPISVLQRVISLPVTSWSYLGQDQVRHIGPTAEDFHAAFGLGGDERYIGNIDADGVALAAIQGLNARVESENGVLREELADLRAELAELRALLAAMSASEGR